MKKLFSILFLFISLGSFSQTIKQKQVEGLSDSLLSKQQRVKWGADFSTNGDSVFLKGDFVNIKDFGAVDDNSTNNSAALAAAVATGKPIFIPPGGIFRFATGITLNNGQMIFGSGRRSQLRFTGTVRAIITQDSCVVKGFTLIGNGKASGNPFETGVLLYDAQNVMVQDMFFVDFGGNPGANGGGGIYGASIAPSNSEGSSISNCRFLNCNVGINFAERSEYVNITGGAVADCNVGVSLATGNFALGNIILEENTTNLKIISGTNNGHGSVTGCLLNHATQLVDIADVPYSLSVTFANCQFYFGSLKFKNANNIRFANCNFGTIDSVHIDNSYFLSDVSGFWGKTSLGNPIPIKLYNGATGFSSIGRARVDATTPIRWINQLKADTSYFNKLFFIDSLVAQTDTTTWKPLVYNATTDQVQYATNWTSGGIGTVTNFSFSDGNGLVGSVSNETTTPQLSVGFINDASSTEKRVVIHNGTAYQQTAKAIPDADYTIGSTDYYILLPDPSTTRTLTLGAASSFKGKHLIIDCRSTATGEWMLSGSFLQAGTVGTYTEDFVNSGLVTGKIYELMSIEVSTGTWKWVQIRAI